MLTVTRRSGEHPSIYTLTRKGARSLRDDYHLKISPARAAVKTKTVAVTPKAEGGAATEEVVVISKHRHAVNWAAIKLIAKGFKSVWSEREIAIGCTSNDVPAGVERLPFRSMSKKQPDLIALNPADASLVTWVELEYSHRKAANLQDLAQWLVWQAFNPRIAHKVSLTTDDRYVLDKVRFVIANKDAATFIARLRVAVASVVDGAGNPVIKDIETWANANLEFATAPPYCGYFDEFECNGWPATEGYRI